MSKVSPATLDSVRLVHYAAKRIKFNPSRKYGDAFGYKPEGFWLSVEDGHGWKEWCEGEQWNLSSFKHAYEVTLKPDANVLVIDSLAKLDAFNTLYGEQDEVSRKWDANISWGKVKAMHDGLIIAPYQWARRLEMMWYYGWDCSSGVIWDLNAVASVKEAS